MLKKNISDKMLSNQTIFHSNLLVFFVPAWDWVKCQNFRWFLNRKLETAIVGAVFAFSRFRSFVPYLLWVAFFVFSRFFVVLYPMVIVFFCFFPFFVFLYPIVGGFFAFSRFPLFYTLFWVPLGPQSAYRKMKVRVVWLSCGSTIAGKITLKGSIQPPFKLGLIF